MEWQRRIGEYSRFCGSFCRSPIASVEYSRRLLVMQGRRGLAPVQATSTFNRDALLPPRSTPLNPGRRASEQRTQERRYRMSILVWIITGIIAGWLAGMVIRGSGFGVIGDLVVGLLGGLIGGYIAGLFGIGPTNWLGTV